ncbi:rhodanese-like domain-containing protein [Flagellimonas hymeniacidonis]|uniref:Rhodanese-like domain-containing protein n=1 Tax=Flagellimonas hymeniacidonis TaxID=2603628 RepID=A0A5C8V9C6_9FLAO|nr:rhodanese-like domain-containing protein [Flagellimonas hymeniacidonis]TXN37388.1 rhodanese-like domain-containing protein [Flagellimonas hymeniacidonis]
MKNPLRITLISFCFLWLSSCQPEQESFIKKIDKETLIAEVMGKDVQLIDVRTPKEYSEGYIDDAVNFNFKDSIIFINQISTLNKEESVYLYCRRGTRSNNAALLLKSRGFKKIYDYTGGYQDWSASE